MSEGTFYPWWLKMSKSVQDVTRHLSLDFVVREWLFMDTH